MISWSEINWENFSTGLYVVIAALLSALGIREGAKRIRAGQEGEKTYEIAGAVIDTRAIRELREATDQNNVHSARLTVQLDRAASAVEKNIATNERLIEIMARVLDTNAELKTEIADLKTEIVRNGAKK